MICSSAEFAGEGRYICGIDGGICPGPEFPCEYEDVWEDEEWEAEL